ncbi:MAG: urea carboxylase [Thioalkalivibrionaceae bacterium]
MAELPGRLLIANRGEIAVRAIRTARRLGIETVAIYSDPDADAMHVVLADQAVSLGGASAAESYLSAERVLEIARATGVDAIFPGYGFLSENADFAAACEASGIAFVGPTPEQIRDFGLKHRARELAAAAGVPLAPGTGLLDDPDAAVDAAQRIGWPVMLKTTAGGGGIGLSRCADAAALRQAFDSVQRLGTSYFADAGVFLERCVDSARHVEVQIFGDGRGRVVAVGERDCSLQRRNQKVVEETPAPGLSPALRDALFDAAERLGRSVAYRGAGTVEFLFDADREAFFFLEVNTRLQVEHPITEMTTGIDLVEWMLRTAAGDPPDLERRPQAAGAAMEVRLYAEDPLHGFRPAPGRLAEVSFPPGAEDGFEPGPAPRDALRIRVDAGVSSGDTVSSHYDPMIAKLIVAGPNRESVRRAMEAALAATVISGTVTNQGYLRQVIAAPFFAQGRITTRALVDFDYRPRVLEVIEPGTYTTVQDLPGRLGYWNIGVPPSGPMDACSFALANALLGNATGAAGLECTIAGATLRFHADADIVLAGAPMSPCLDGVAVPCWTVLHVVAGQLLEMGRVEQGARAYLCVAGGLPVPTYLGSRSTFALGQFGGHGGRTLAAGDQLALAEGSCCEAGRRGRSVPLPLRPDFPVGCGSCRWEIGVMVGPHGAPDFFKEDAIRTFFASDYEVHYNSNRLGVRLIGPKPSWARSDGGEAGLHPSNIHDTEYAIGAINFTGDMPVILGPDGPSLGGFVCPATIVQADRWKMGQLQPGDRVRFVPIDYAQARARARTFDEQIGWLAHAGRDSTDPAEAMPPLVAIDPFVDPAGDPVRARLAARAAAPGVVMRQAGDTYLLLEYGDNVLDLRARLRVHALMEALAEQAVPGVEECSPGVRSLQIRFDPERIGQAALVETLLAIEDSLPAVDTMSVPSRIVHLPLAFEDSATLEAVLKYRRSVRDSAPWLPRNAEFIRRANGLETVDDVAQTLFDASYLVLGLGDVYLGAPCAVPVDPRHRLRTSKYNPARTFTAEGTVGIGGVYMCIYGMDSPGGYQLVGRTLPIWNRFLQNPQFVDGKPWLLRFFDQVRFYPVDEATLAQARTAFRRGRYPIRIEDSQFDMAAHEAFLAANAQSISAFRERQDAAFAAEIAHWSEADLLPADAEPPKAVEAIALEPGETLVRAELTGSVWKCLVAENEAVEAGATLIILEAMKMEFPVIAPRSGRVVRLLASSGQPVQQGAGLVVLA